MDLSNNKIAELPPQFPKKLKYLRIQQNELTEIPEGISQCTCLTHLDISHNLLRHLPDGLSDLGKLQNLQADYNLLTEIPPSLH